MIVERLVFRGTFGQGDAIERSFRDLAHFDELQKADREMYGAAEFVSWFEGWSAATESGGRELYRVLE